MIPLCCILLLQFATSLALGQAAHNHAQPEALVRSLYTQVIAHHPSGLLTDAEMKIIAPYLSKSLRHKIDNARACSADWDRHNPDPHLKSQLDSQFGLFTGEYHPTKFNINSTQATKDGSFRVYVSLISAGRPDRRWRWRVAPIIVRENGLTVDDVIYVDDASWDNEADRRNMLLSQYLSAGCNGPHWIGPSLPTEPEAFVRSLYTQVLARRTVGIPIGEDWKVFAPYISKTLLHRIDLAIACEADWDRKYGNAEPVLKPPFGTLEMGIFSGQNEQTAPRTFHIERTNPQKDGSIRVYVTLGLPQFKMTWPVAVDLHREDARLAIDDVIFLKDERTNLDKDYRLSEALSYGCRGPRWVAPD